MLCIGIEHTLETLGRLGTLPKHDHHILQGGQSQSVELQGAGKGEDLLLEGHQDQVEQLLH